MVDQQLTSKNVPQMSGPATAPLGVNEPHWQPPSLPSLNLISTAISPNIFFPSILWVLHVIILEVKRRNETCFFES